MAALFQQIKAGYNAIWKFIKPPYEFSWRTLFFLSVFSCLMAALAGGIVRFGISLAGFIFLILAITWALIEKPIKIFGLNLAHWIPGSFISFLLFGYWWLTNPFWFVVSLPISAALVATAGEFVTPHLQFKRADASAYQRIVITVLSYLVVSCWLAFGFTIYQWLDRYPSLKAIHAVNTIKNSNFVVRVNLAAGAPTLPPVAVQLLDDAESLARIAVHEKAWGESVQAWATAVSQNPYLLQSQLQLGQSGSAETPLWRVESRIADRYDGYDLYLLAIWRGPSSDPQGYY
ncbi:MAG: DUF5357 domain-containing protein, partial [Cyanobacteria bacterium]|nr:DUF5357 domain-containing protein [Cyanobacteriota bacterium]MDW8200620.1 DUF5357 family protein [Cyanobacteriota bacterium SKYGB_h_bin112]